MMLIIIFFMAVRCSYVFEPTNVRREHLTKGTNAGMNFGNKAHDDYERLYKILDIFSYAILATLVLVGVTIIVIAGIIIPRRHRK